VQGCAYDVGGVSKGLGMVPFAYIVSLGNKWPPLSVDNRCSFDRRSRNRRTPLCGQRVEDELHFGLSLTRSRR
jgi:hypothetical protein